MVASVHSKKALKELTLFIRKPSILLCFPQISALEAVLEHVSECRTVCQQLEGGVADSSDPTFSLLALYEFEAKLHLGHPDLEGVLERVSSMSLTEPKTFETIAGRALPSMPSTDPSFPPPSPPSPYHPSFPFPPSLLPFSPSPPSHTH